MMLKVPYQRQFNGSACFPAAVAMVLAYYGRRVSQKRLFKAGEFRNPETGESMGCYDAGIMFALEGSGYVMDCWMDYKKGVKMSDGARKLLREYKPQLQRAVRMGLIRTHVRGGIATIRGFLKKGIPVIAEVHINTLYNSKFWDDEITHSVVVIGHEKGKFVVHDPNAAYRGYAKDGRNVRISEELLKRALDCPYYRNSICVLQKKA